MHVHDPVVRQLPERWSGRVVSYSQALDALTGAGVLVVGTEWPEFRQAAAELNPAASPNLVVIDANRYLQAAVASMGLTYLAVGTPSANGV